MARAAPQSHPYNRSASSSSSRNSRQQPSSSSAQAGSENHPVSASGTQHHHHHQRRQSGGSSSRAASRALADCKKFPSDGSDAASATAASSPSGGRGGGRSPRMPDSVPALLYLLAIPLTLIHLMLHLLRRLLQLRPPPQSSGSGRSGGVRRASDGPGDDNGRSGDDGGGAGADGGDPDDLLRSILAERGLDAPGSSGGGEASDYLSVPASPAIATLLDDALYRAYCAELVPTVSAASRLLTEFLSMKEASALILRECRWAVGAPMSPEGLLVVDHDEKGEETEVALGTEGNGIFLGGGVVVDTEGNPFRARGGGSSAFAMAESPESVVEQLHAEEIARWNEFDIIQDFAQQCYLCANEAIQRLTTDRLAESANVTLQDSIASTGKKGEEAAGGGVGQRENDDDSAPRLHPPQSPAAPSVLLMPADSGIGRCYAAQPRRGCFESPRLYCPDYTWADDAIGGCQRLLKALSRHRFVTLVATHGWERYDGATSSGSAGRKSGGRDDNEDDDEDNADARVVRAPTYASATPHLFPSLEAAHALRYLLSDLLSTAVPARLNQFRAAAEANAVVSKRLYLVKCEYRAPARALWESYANLDAAPRTELVERYLREYHGVKVGGGGGPTDNVGEGGGGGKAAGSLRRKGSTGETKKSAAQQQREKLEKIITEKYWKHPAFVEALQLERCCERLEVDMSQMLLPLSELACEIMNGWKGRLRAVAVVQTLAGSSDEEENKDEGSSESDDSSEEGDDAQHDALCVTLAWHEVPFMRELLRRLKSILRRKPDLDESTGIRPLLLDLQGVPRHVQDNQDAIDSSTEIPFHPPVSNSFLSGWPVSKKPAKDCAAVKDEWFYLEQFLSQIKKLLELLSQPNMPFLVEERTAGSKGNKNTVIDLAEQCQETWDEEMFRAQFKDWFDMVKRQKELDAGGALSTLADSIREAEIELSVAMAPRDQLERVRKRLDALRADKEARYRVLRHIVFDLGYRELNDVIVVEPPADDEATVMFPKLSEPGVFGDQITLSGGVLPVG